MMTRSLVTFEPLDVVFSRDHRPFSIGDHSRATSAEPGITLLVGALRAALYGSTPRPPPEVLGDATLGGAGLAISGPFMWSRSDARLWCPLPRDVYRTTGGAYKLARERAVPAQVRAWPKSPSGALLWQPDADDDRADPLLDTAALEAWAAGRTIDAGDLCEMSDARRHERRLGLARDASRTAQESLLYNLDVYRFRAGWRLALCVDADGAALRAVRALSSTTIALGGDGHRATIEVYDAAKLVFGGTTTALAAGTCARLLLLSPLPVERATLAEILEGQGLRLRTLLGARARAIGGWDMKNRTPRPLEVALPAGTVLSVDVLVATQTGERALRPRGAVAEARLDRHLGFGHALLAPPMEDLGHE